MSKKSTVSFGDHLGCFGDFSVEDPICKKFCALNLRCAIEREQTCQMEIMEELTSVEGMFLKMH